MDELPGRAGVVVIGAGVIGCSIARELTRYTHDVVILDKESDVSSGTSKANNAEVHSGIGEKSGTLKQRLNVRGNQMYDDFVSGLNVDFRRQGLLIVITPRSLPEGLARYSPGFLCDFLNRRVLPRLIVRSGNRKGIPWLTVVDRDEIFRMEPNVTRDAIVGVHDRTYGLVSPYKLTIALAEHAVLNGARLCLDTRVTGIRTEGGAVRAVVTDAGEIECGIVVNAAGVYADEIADMAGAGGFRIHGRKGATLIFDREATREYVKGSVAEFRITGRKKRTSKGGGAMPTLEGNLQLGPTAIEVDDKEDTSISGDEIREIFDRFHYLLPDFPRDSVIAMFSGVRAPSEDEDFIIGASKEVAGFVNVAGMQSPGLASAPAVAEMVMQILHDLGIPRVKRAYFNQARPTPRMFADCERAEQEALIERDRRHGHIVCRCEQVTEADVVNAIHGVVPARSMDAVKRRTRAGMGRCQGGFCTPWISEILARELGVPRHEITKKGPGSELFVGPAKCLLDGASRRDGDGGAV
ncbi:MAG: NAD(P)/FAD-dependent oxidoreductase [Actinobacteria bacterium]|nr:NAD(P)/FAD-dependent oxidoreductase [Actinomycetota bacterium]MBU1944592.1 NAD(P)/FAD-dependent oxidoreductase [Actinomycetota bacterium]MBU2689145.1 NAD(P)/FAD-dependent oxidoreductase [Actinomycetota bacterium]